MLNSGIISCRGGSIETTLWHTLCIFMTVVLYLKHCVPCLSFVFFCWEVDFVKKIKSSKWFFASLQCLGDGSLPKRSGRKINQHCGSFCSRHTSSLDPVEGEAGLVVCLMALFAARCYTPAKSVRSVAWRGLQSQLEVAGVIWDRKAPDRQKPTQWHRQTGNHTHAHTHCYTRLRTRQVQDRLIH